MFIKILFHLSLLLFFSSCLKQQESISPIAQTQTLADLQKESLMHAASLAGNSDLSSEAKATLEMASDPSIFYLNIKYNMTDIDVFQAANMPNMFEQIGHSFLQTVTKAVLAIGGPRQVSINDINFTIPDSVNLDRSMIKSIQIKRIFLQYNKEVDAASDYAANFAFIDSLELARPIALANGKKVDTLFLSYRKTRNLCMFKCIQFDVLEDNLIDLLKPNLFLTLKPTLSLSSLPAINDLKIDGQIELKIGLKLPF